MASVLISEAEKVYVLHGVQENIRFDGRGRKDVRPIVFESGLVSLIWTYRKDLDAWTEIKFIFLKNQPIFNWEINLEKVTHASGSAHLRLANTDVLVGIKAELTTPLPERPHEGNVLTQNQ